MGGGLLLIFKVKTVTVLMKTTITGLSSRTDDGINHQWALWQSSDVAISFAVCRSRRHWCI
jgi:hypothetical protein